MPGRLIKIPLWWIVVGVMTCVLTPILSTVLSVRISEQNADKTTSQQRQLSCDLDAKILAAFKPTATSGVELRNAFLVHYQQTGCTPAIQ